MAAAYSPYGLSHAERSRHAITSLHLANHYPTTEAGLAAEKVREGDNSRDTKPLLWSQYDHKYPSPGATGALCSPSSQPPEPCPPHQSWPTAYTQPHPSHYPGLEVASLTICISCLVKTTVKSKCHIGLCGLVHFQSTYITNQRCEATCPPATSTPPLTIG